MRSVQPKNDSGLGPIDWGGSWKCLLGVKDTSLGVWGQKKLHYAAQEAGRLILVFVADYWTR